MNVKEVENIRTAGAASKC